MGREIDERVVAMYFENSDFERSAGKTLKTLSKLRDESDLSGSAKGFETLQQAAKKLDLDSVRRSAESLKNSLGGVGNVIGKAFKVGTAPLQSIENLFKTFRSYAAKFIGFDIAGKFVSTMENSLRQLTIAPIQEGFAQYEQRMDSVKTIMSGSGEEIDVVNAKLSKLTEYANKTIYSLSDMTSNIGKFTNNGVKLDQATDAMMGIANATALAGQGAQQASMAMYNISQAIGVGAMTTIDWKSIENANIATQQLKKTFMEVAVAKGTLVKKTEKDKKTGEETVKYFVKGFEKGKKAVEVTVSNFRETLNKKWLDAATMTETFSIMSGQYTKEELQRMGYTEKEAEEYYKLGQEAMKAATEVRTFHKMWDALRESTQAGWATSFEYILGDVNEATALWTSLSDTFSEILDKNAETRNNILLAWRGLEKQEDGTLKRVSQQDGREVLIRSLEQMIRIGQRIGSIFSNAWEQVAGKMTGERLYNITERIAEGIRKVSLWLGNTTDKSSRLNKLTKAMSGLLTIFKMAGKAVKTFGDLAKRLLGPVVDGVLSAFGELGGFITSLGDLDPAQVLERVGDGLSKVWDKVKSFFSPKELYDSNGNLTSTEPPFMTALRNFWDGLKSTVREWAADHGLDQAWETFKKMAKPTLDAIGGFLEQPLSWIRSVFTKKKQYDDRGFELNDSKAPVEEFLGNILNKIRTAWTAVKNWKFWGEVGSFLSNTWEWIRDQFTGGTTKDVDEKGNVTFRTTASPVESFLQRTLASIESGWNAVRTWGFWTDVSTFLSNTWSWITGNFTPRKQYDDRGFELNNTKTQAEEFLESIWNGIVRAWEGIRTWSFWTDVSTFLSSTWSWITGNFTPKKRYDDRGFELNDTRSPVEEFLQNAWDSIANVWTRLVNWSFWTDVSTFLNSTAGWITSQFTPRKQYDDRGFELNDWKSPVEEFLGNIWDGIVSTWSSIRGWSFWTDVSTFLNSTFSWITSQFAPRKRYDDRGFELNEQKSPVEEFLGNIWDGIVSTWNSIRGWSFWTDVSTFLNSTASWITGQFTPKKRYDERGFELNDQRSPVEEFLGNVWEGIQRTWTTIRTWGFWADVSTFLNSTANWITNQFAPKKLYDDRGFELNDRKSPVEEFLGNIWDGIKSIWNSVVNWEGWAPIGKFLTDTWGWITGLFAGAETSTAGSVDGPAELVKQMAEEVNEDAKKLTGAEGETERGVNIFDRVIEKIGGFFEKVKELAHEMVGQPELERFFVALGDVLKVIFTKITEALETIARIGKGEGTAGDWAVVGLGVLLVIISKVGDFFNNKHLAGIDGGTDFATKFLKIAGGLLIMSAAVALLSTIELGKLVQGGVAVAVLGGLAYVIIKAIEKMKKAAASSPVTAGERITGKIVGALEKVGMVAVAMALLPPIIEKIGEVRKTLGKDGGNFGNDVLLAMTGMAVAIGGIGLSLAILQKVTGKNGLDPVGTAKTVGSIVIAAAEIVGAISVGGVLAGAIEKIGATEFLIEGLGKLSELFGAIGNAIGSLFGGLVGGYQAGKSESERKNLERQLDWLSEISTKLNTKNIEKILDITDVMTRITDSTHNMNYNDAQLLITLIAGEAGVMGLAEAFATFIEKMNSVAIRDDIDLDRLRDTCLALSTLTGPIESLADSKDSWWSLTDIADGILSLAHGLAYGSEGLEGFGAAGTEHYNKLMAALDVFGAFAGGVGKLGGLERSNLIDMVNWVNDIAQDKKLKEFSTNLHKIIEELGSDEDSGIQFDGITIVQKLYDAIQNGLRNPSLPAFDASGITDAIVVAIGLEESRINLAIQSLINKAMNFKTEDDKGQTTDFGNYEEYARQMQDRIGNLTTGLDGNPETTITVKVVPVLDEEALNGTVTTAEQLLANNPIIMRGFQLGGTTVDLSSSMDSVVAEIQNTNLKLDSLIAAVEKNNTDRSTEAGKFLTGLGDVEKSFGKAKVFLDGKILVGGLIDEIDRQLYNRYILAGQVYK